MDRVRKTPPHGVVGFYEVLPPFTLSTTKQYQCTAIRSFSELALRGIDVYQTFYAPKEIPEEEYLKDAEVSATIITLQDENGEMLVIPDTYIKRYPNLQLDQFKRVILSCDLGALEIGTGVNHVIEVVKQEVEKIYGRSVVVKTSLAPLINNTLSPEELMRAELNRQTTAKSKNTPGGMFMELSTRYRDLKAYCDILQGKLRNLGGDKDAEIAKITTSLETKTREYDVLTAKHNALVEDKAVLQTKHDDIKSKLEACEKLIVSSGLEIPY